jgi:hypothetical protein
MEGEEPKLPAVRSIAWLGLWMALPKLSDQFLVVWIIQIHEEFMCVAPVNGVLGPLQFLKFSFGLSGRQKKHNGAYGYILRQVLFAGGIPAQIFHHGVDNRDTAAPRHLVAHDPIGLWVSWPQTLAILWNLVTGPQDAMNIRIGVAKRICRRRGVTADNNKCEKVSRDTHRPNETQDQRPLARARVAAG